MGKDLSGDLLSVKQETDKRIYIGHTTILLTHSYSVNEGTGAADVKPVGLNGEFIYVVGSGLKEHTHCIFIYIFIGVYSTVHYYSVM